MTETLCAFTWRAINERDTAAHSDNRQSKEDFVCKPGTSNFNEVYCKCGHPHGSHKQFMPIIQNVQHHCHLKRHWRPDRFRKNRPVARRYCCRCPKSCHGRSRFLVHSKHFEIPIVVRSKFVRMNSFLQTVGCSLRNWRNCRFAVLPARSVMIGCWKVHCPHDSVVVRSIHPGH